MRTDRRSSVAVVVAAVVLGGVLLAPRAAGARQGEYGEAIVEGGGSFLTGDYGTENTTDIWQGSIRLGYALGPVEASVTAPALAIRTVGTATPTGGGFASGEDDDGGFFGSGDDDGEDASGLGDVLFEARLRVVRQGEGWEGPSLEVVGQAKAPTADEEEGLGTGEWDGGGGLAATWTRDRVTLYGDARLIAIGEPDHLDLEPVVLTWLGTLSYRVSQEDAAISPFLYAAGSSPVREGSEPPAEVGAGLVVGERRPGRVAPRFTLTVAGGLTDGSPDARVALAIELRFGVGEMPGDGSRSTRSRSP